MGQDDVDEFLKDKEILSADSNQQCVTKESKLQTAPKEIVIEKSDDYESVSSPKKKWRRKEESSSSGSEVDASVFEDHPNSDENQRLASALPEVLCVEKEVDILVKLRYSLQVDKKTRDYLGKVLTSVHCESTNLSSRNRRKNDDRSTSNCPPIVTKSCRLNSSPSLVSVPISSSISSPNSKQENISKEEWKNLKLLTTTMMNFANAKLHEKEGEYDSKECANRPRERIHFSTPEVEEKYRKIVEELKRQDRISSDCDGATNKNVPIKKRKYDSDIFIEPPEVPEKSEAEIEATLGPIPPADSNLFRGMAFILTCFSREFIDPHQIEAMENTTDAENEEQWTRKPFVKERLIAQLKAGGGEIYESFELVPPVKYKTTMLITNIPNLTAKSLLCLSVGIKAYNHQWIIRCCQENKIVNPAEDQLPAGWSLIKQSYVEMFQRPSQRPFLSTLPVVVVIPIRPAKQQFVSLWKQIFVNAGADVLLVKDSADDFMEATVVLTHSLCPSWLIQKAQKWDIPLVSTRWAIECLIEGQVCSYDAHPSFDYNYIAKLRSSTLTL